MGQQQTKYTHAKNFLEDTYSASFSECNSKDTLIKFFRDIHAPSKDTKLRIVGRKKMLELLSDKGTVYKRQWMNKTKTTNESIFVVELYDIGSKQLTRPEVKIYELYEWEK